MKPRYPILVIGGLGCSAWGFFNRPFPMPGDDPMLDLVLYHPPQLLYLDRLVVLPCSRSRSHRRRSCSYLGLAGLVLILGASAFRTSECYQCGP